jgi:hypothetical protein
VTSQPSLTARLLQRFGSSRHPERPVEHRRPAGTDDATVDALGKLGAALETAEDARGHLYAFHRLSGRADLDAQDAVQALRACGRADLADAVDQVVIGRDVVPGMWSFQIVEAYDANYLEVFRAVERAVRDAVDAPPHLFEAELKHHEQTSGA